MKYKSDNSFYYLIILLGLAIMLFSCNPLKKAVKTFDENPNVAALYCSVNFPAKDSLIKGDTVVLLDTLETQGPVIEVQVPGDTVKIKGQCPPVKVITKFSRVTDTIIRIDHAKEIVMAGEIQKRDKTIGERDSEITELKGELKAMKGKRDKWRLWVWILVGAAGAYTFLKIKKILPF